MVVTLQVAVIFVFSILFPFHSSSAEPTAAQPDTAEGRDYCSNPETASQGRLLELSARCSIVSEDCPSLVHCLSEQLVAMAEETTASCKQSSSDGGSNSPVGFRPCSMAATVYVLLEQIRRLLAEETVYKECRQVRDFMGKILKYCGEPGRDLESYKNDFDPDNLVLQDTLAKFLVGVGKQMQTYDTVKEDIAELEKSKHIKALWAMLLSFALPGLLGLCEASHFRTGLILQILALFVIGIYQFSRYGGYWAFVGVTSCLLVMIVELALLVLIRRKFFNENPEEVKKSE